MLPIFRLPPKISLKDLCNNFKFLATLKLNFLEMFVSNLRFVLLTLLLLLLFKLKDIRVFV